MNISSSWICLVCGYVHQGDDPPDTCPVCGAPASDFEAHATPAPKASGSLSQWRCLICGYVHEGAEPPGRCPICNAPSEDFEACAPTTITGVSSRKNIKVVIIGAGIAGVSAAEALRERMPEAEILLVSKESELPYYRLNLTRYLAGEISDEALPIHPQSWYDTRRIRLLPAVEAIAVAPEARVVTLSDGSQESFDKLILACGAHPFLPPFPGVDRQGVTAVRTAEDARTLLTRIGPGTSCVCIGGGILGLETAGALARRGGQVTLIESFGYLLPRQLTPDAARILEAHVEALGIRIVRNATISGISGETPALSVALESGDALAAEVITVTTGVRANTHLARKAKLTVNNGIVVDANLTTSCPDIFAVGDVAECGGLLYGLWEPARYQGCIAGMNVAGETAAFGGLPRMNTLKVLGLKMFSSGVIQPEDGSYHEIADKRDDVYHRFLFHDNKLAGAILIGDTAAASGVSKAMKEGIDFSVLLKQHADAKNIANYLAAGG